MQLKTVTWNIGGGKILKPDADPSLLVSYSEEGLGEIIKTLKQIDADIITLQEAQGNELTNQVAYISEQLGFGNYLYDPTSQSHIDTTQSLGCGIISKHPIIEHRAGYFYNPNIEFDLEGTLVKSHTKGYVQCLINMQDMLIRTTSLHLTPFRRMNIDLDGGVAQKILDSVTDEIRIQDECTLIQGDYNIDSETLSSYLKRLFEHGKLSEISLPWPTTPKGRKYDHVLFKGMKLIGFQTYSTVKTDHYPVVCNFEIEV